MNTNGPEANLPEGWPDLETIERLANRFFNATPETAPAIPSTDSLDPLNPLGGTAAPAIEIPGEAELRALLTPVAPAAGPAAEAAAAPYYFLKYAPSSPRGLSVPEFLPDLAIPSTGGREPLDVLQIRRDFPILQERVNGRPLIWLDNAATTQKPAAVIERLKYFYEHENSNIHRAAHELAARATDAYEQAREKVRGFLNASSAKEIVFVRGATEAINLVALSWGRQHIDRDDEIVVTWLEHHANIVPWQQLATEKGARLRVVPVDDSGQVLLDAYGKLLGPRTKLVAFTHVSNALGTITPVEAIVEGARSVGAKVLLDGAQAVSHLPVDVQDLDPDWYVFSGHKVFAPTGIGVLYGKEELLNQMQPWQGGGNMIKDVTFDRTSYQPAPGRFEAGTGNIADAAGMGAAIDYVSRIGMARIAEYEHGLLVYATRLLTEIPGLRLIGTAPDKAGVLSFVLDGHRTEDIGAALNREGIAVRAGHHCAQPILRRFGVESTVRPSLAFYNTCAEIDALIAALARIAGGRNPVIS
jgi:cysteine desulfurase/selenocysteine lyase